MKTGQKNAVFVRILAITLIALMSSMLLFSFACKKEAVTEEPKIDVEETTISRCV